jgi:AcrR family transcriptional regulator
MNHSKSYNAWIKAGYELFAQEGPEGIQIERLARILELNKSGFYHYFGNHDTFYQHLIHHHLLQADLLAKRIKSLDNFMPGCIQILAESSMTVLMQKQLQRASHIPIFAKAYQDMNNKVDHIILPLWADFIDLSDNPSLALFYLDFVRDIFYARVTSATLSFEFIFDICMQAKEVGDGFKNSYSPAVGSRYSA